MQERIGNLWPHLGACDLLLFTACSYVRQDGCLTMGAGFAKQVKTRYPGLDSELGAAIPHLGEFGLQLSAKYPVGAFQSKTHYGWPSELGLIKRSVEALCAYLEGLDECSRAARYDTPAPTVYLNFPGIGFGGLNIVRVRALLVPLPDHVVVWRKSPFN